MNWKKQLLAVTLSFSALVWGCKENPYDIEYTIGTWKMQELKTVTYAEGSVIDDQTRTDSLPTWDLWATGEGLRTSASGVQDTFIWESSESQQKMVIYYRAGFGPHMFANILDLTLDTRTLYWKTEDKSTNPILTKEYTAKIAKQ